MPPAVDPAQPPTKVIRISRVGSTPGQLAIGVATNNVAEYRALIAGLEAAAPFGARRVRVRADSLLVVQQLKGLWKVKQPHLRPLHEQARRLLARYADVDLRHVPREQNVDADALVNAALDAVP